MVEFDLARVDLTNKNILIVDDTPDNLRLLINILKKANYKVRPAPNGKAALAAVKASKPDLVLLDINMPEMDGYEVCRILKTDEKTNEIPVIFISAMHETIDKLKAFEVGGIDYITKPFHYEEVLARVETHLKLYLFQKKLESTNELLEKKVEERTAELLKLHTMRERFELELKVAQNIQASMLPKQKKFKNKFPEININAFTNPAKLVGGDFYDYFVLDEDAIFFCIGDVSGKGVPAAMFMTIVMTLIKMQAKSNLMPHEIIEKVNGFIYEENDTCMFASITCGRIDLKTRNIKFCNAGHTAPLIVNAGNSHYLPVMKETVVGVLESHEGDYVTEQVILSENERLFLYSDGVTEAINPEKQQYSKDRVLNLFKNLSHDLSDTDILNTVNEELDKFTRSEPQSDDITMMLISFAL